MELKYIILISYAAVISLIAVLLTVYDKIAAKSNPGHRIPENTLMYISVLGGAPAMLVTMLIIRHKTKHKKFMIGIPVIIVIQAILIFAAVYFKLFG